MWRHIWPLALAIGCILPATVAGDDDKAAQAVVEKAIKAHGGSEELSKYSAGRAKFTGRTMSPNGWVDFTDDVAFMLPDKLRKNTEVTNDKGKMHVALRINGREQSLKVNGKECDESAKAQLKDATYLIEIGQLVPLTKKDGRFSVSSLPSMNIEGKMANGVLVRSQGHEDVRLFFDAEKGVLIKLEHRVGDPWTQKDLLEEIIYSDYKTVQKLATQGKVAVHRDGKPHTEMRLQEIVYLKEMDENEFKK